ncbi:MAG TPA: hypothetical protein VGU23_03455 [Acidobacteriaceae bacterium]|nr:hypothetical protein [Acidobacteriaceae bacterium]
MSQTLIQFSQLSSKERIRFLHLLSQGIILHARGLASDDRKSTEVRLSQSDAIIEMLHRIAEQGEHYYKADDAQRPDADLFQILQTLETAGPLRGMVASASEYAWRKLPDAK